MRNTTTWMVIGDLLIVIVVDADGAREVRIYYDVSRERLERKRPENSSL